MYRIPLCCRFTHDLIVYNSGCLNKTSSTHLTCSTVVSPNYVAMTSTSSTPTAASGMASVTAAVRLELPMFDASDVDTWITMCDNLLADAGITVQATMFRKLLAKLPPHHFRLVKHLATASPLAANCYDELKSCLRKRLQLTPALRLQRLDHLPPCSGDRTPSVLFAELDSLYPKDTNHEIIHEHFLRRLPRNLQLLCREWLVTDTLAEVAHRADTHFSSFLGDSVSQVNVDALTARREEDDDSPAVFAVHRSDRTKNSEKFRRPRDPPQVKDYVDRWCRIHRRYGPAARKCITPCSYSSDMNSASGNASGNR